MKNIFSIGLCLILASAGAFAKVGVWLANGISFNIETYAEPPIALHDMIAEGGVMVKKAAQRYLINRTNRTYLGYDLDAERLPDGSYRVYIKPLTATPDQVSPPGLKLAVIPSYPDPQIVRDGEVILLPLMESPRTGHRIIDRIEINAVGLASPTERDARDLTMLDVALQLQEPVLSRNGKRLDVNDRMNREAVGGPIIWFYVPERGRFVLSVIQHQSRAFARAGVIRDNRLTFTVGGESYECRTKSPILGSPGIWNLYVRHEPNYRPRWNNEGEGYQFGSAAGMESLPPPMR
jgi:hypothetical protein